MENRLIFLYHVGSVTTDGGTGKGKRTQAMVVLGQARSQSLQVNPQWRFYARCDASWIKFRPVSEPMPPRKASREDPCASTDNRHRWTRRRY